PGGGAELDRVAGQIDEGVFQRRLLGDELGHRDPGGGGGRADLGGGQAGYGQRAAAGGGDRHPGGAEQARPGGLVGAADRHWRGGGRGDELAHAGVGDQAAPADHDQVRGGLRDLAHQVRGDENRLPLRGQVGQQAADPADALDIQAVHRLVQHHG